MELKRTGVIRHIGMSSHNPKVAKKAAESGYVEMILFSINPAFDMLPASENIDTMFAEEFDSSLKGIDADRARLYKACEENDVGIKGATKVAWKEDACISCGLCVKVCREGALKLEDGKITLDQGKCNYCGRCVKSCPTDAWDSQSAYLVSCGGTFGNTIKEGRYMLPPITSEEQLFRVTDAAIQFFDDHANAGERFKFTIDRVGSDKLYKVLKEAYDG